MSDIIRPGAGVIFMKVGTHAKENLADIIARKRKEIEDEGIAMWGYGGNTCHPSTMVQPFARDFAERQQPIHLIMQRMNSRHYAEQVRARQYSMDGSTWKSVPSGINVLGSRFALVIKSLSEHEDALDLSSTRVAVGRNQGRLGSHYVQGQADKACLEIIEPERSNEPRKKIPISLVAELEEPYAVFLRED